MKKVYILIAAIIFAFILNLNYHDSHAEELGKTVFRGLSEEQKKEIDECVKKQMKKGIIPGLAVSIVHGDQIIFQENYGYSDLKNKTEVTPETIFEIGSCSKAFTGLGLLSLSEEGRVDLNASVREYLPWLQLKYASGKETIYPDITLSQVMHHTSGIPYTSISDIPEGSDIKLLEDTVRGLTDTYLSTYPGTEYEYATVNYDILGCIIEKVTNQSYDDYITEHVLNPLGLEQTYVFQSSELEKNKSKGYKLMFMRPREYKAPDYRGNTPAGYINTNIMDFSKWMMAQMQTIDTANLGDLIEESHQPDRSVAPQANGSSYAVGWQIFQSGEGEIVHTGNNPNYSASIMLKKGDDLGIAMLANINTQYLEQMSKEIRNIIYNRQEAVVYNDMYKEADKFASVMSIITMLILITTIVLTVKIIAEIMQKKRRLKFKRNSFIKVCGTAVIVVAAATFALYHSNEIVMSGSNWSFVKVWAPNSLTLTLAMLFATTVAAVIYGMIEWLYPRENKNSYFILILISICSGCGNALLIIIINNALLNIKKFQLWLMIYFVLCVLLYAIGQKIVRAKLIHITNDLVYQKRSGIVQAILHSSYERFEKIGTGRIQTALNNDTETISNFAGVVTLGFTNLVTLLCCFVYLSSINFISFIVSLFIVVAAATLYSIVGKKSRVLWEETRSLQDVFFEFINDILYGFKELAVNHKKRSGFSEDMFESSHVYKSKRIKADVMFTNVFIIGELIFTAVIGAVLFIYPMVFKNLDITMIRNYVFIYMYMTAPVRGILNSIPNIISIRVSWQRLNDFLNEINETIRDVKVDITIPKQVELSLMDVEYEYVDEDTRFKVGTIDYSFKNGTIYFITGGNGSGKSTLANLITGLYSPSKGKIYVNEREVNSRELGEMFTFVFSDYYVFRKLYGIDVDSKKEEITELLSRLHLSDKLQIEADSFSTLNLSTGQKKRLALLVCCLEDKSVYLFDEWASDQDPEFRRFFYTELLPELKNRGKCVIVITHDDAYFEHCDYCIQMQMGKIVNA